MPLPALATVINPAVIGAIASLIKVITDAPDFDLRGGVRVTEADDEADFQFYLTKTTPTHHGA